MNNEETPNLDRMFRNGYLDEMIDSHGEKRYAINQKFRDEQPQAAQQWDAILSETVASLWSKGWIDVSFESDMDIEVSLTDKLISAAQRDPQALAEIKTLSDIEIGVLSSITERVLAENGR